MKARNGRYIYIHVYIYIYIYNFMHVHVQLSLVSEFISSPGVCRTYIGESCTLIWTVHPPIPYIDGRAQVIYKGVNTGDHTTEIIFATAFLGPHKRGNYWNRNLTFTGSGVDGGPYIGFTLNGIQCSDADNFTCLYDAVNNPITNNDGLIFIYGES